MRMAELKAEWASRLRRSSERMKVKVRGHLHKGLCLILVAWLAAEPSHWMQDLPSDNTAIVQMRWSVGTHLEYLRPLNHGATTARRHCVQCRKLQGFAG